MGTSRRSFLLTGIGALGLLLASGKLQRLSGKASGLAGNPLYIPPAFSGSQLTADMFMQEIWSGKPTDVMGYNGAYLGPTIRIRKGATLDINFNNKLTDHTTVHWHGLTVPATMDGHPKYIVDPGASYRYTFDIVQRAGTYWYHPHPHMMTAEQVYKGLAGLLIVEDDEESALALPRNQFDVPLVLQDKRSDPNGALKYDPSHMDVQFGYLGDTVLVNGTPDPYFEVERGLYRFRILNGSNARIYNLAFANAMPFHIIGTDGGLLDKPYQVTSTFLAPAERIEVLVDFSSLQTGSSVVLKSLEFEGEGGISPASRQGAAFDLLRFDITRDGTPPVRTVPSTLIPYSKLNEADALRTRVFELRMQPGNMDHMHTINSKYFDMSRVDETVVAGETEIWEFRNIGQDYHPMHVHGLQFQVLDRSGGPVTPSEMGWKDTVLLYPSDFLRVIMKFPSTLGTFLLHCHNLEHEDEGMMLQYDITAPSGVSTGPTSIGRMDLK